MFFLTEERDTQPSDIVKTPSYSSGDEPLLVGVPAPLLRIVIIEIPASSEEQSPEGPNPAVPKPDRKPSWKPEELYGRKLLFYFLYEFIRICRSLFNFFSRQENGDGNE